MRTAAKADGGRLEPRQRGFEVDPKKRLELVGLRQDVAVVMSEHQYSERKDLQTAVDRWEDLSVSARQDHNAELREKLLALARQKSRYGYRRLCVLPERDGVKASPQRVYRVYSAECLAVQRLKRKRSVRPGVETTLLTRVNEEPAIDFVADGLGTGWRRRILTVVDSFPRECPAIEVDTSLCSRRVTRVLDRVIDEPGKSEVIRCDNRPEFTGRVSFGDSATNV